MKILSDKSGIICCIKPRGYASEETPGTKNAVDELKKLTNSDIKPLHRLDTGTAGIMLYAKNKQSAAKVSKIISDGLMEKEYLALVHGRPKENTAQLCDLLFKDSSKNKVFVVDRDRKGVKKAVLNYTVRAVFSPSEFDGTPSHIVSCSDSAFSQDLLSFIGSYLDKAAPNDEISLVSVRLVTGRTHQIRVQFSHRHNALVGDKKYGARDKAAFISLVSRKISLPDSSFFLDDKTALSLLVSNDIADM